MYRYYNPNPKARVDKKTGKPCRWSHYDCVVRAVCCLTGKSWMDAYKFICECGAKVYDMPDGPKAIAEAMKQLGGTKYSWPRGEKRQTVEEIAWDTAGKDYVIIANLAGHVVCCKNGAYWDTWNSGDRTAYTMWIFNKK